MTNFGDSFFIQRKKFNIKYTILASFMYLPKSVALQKKFKFKEKIGVQGLDTTKIFHIMT